MRSHVEDGGAQEQHRGRAAPRGGARLHGSPPRGGSQDRERLHPERSSGPGPGRVGWHGVHRPRLLRGPRHRPVPGGCPRLQGPSWPGGDRPAYPKGRFWVGCVDPSQQLVPPVSATWAPPATGAGQGALSPATGPRYGRRTGSQRRMPPGPVPPSAPRPQAAARSEPRPPSRHVVPAERSSPHAAARAPGRAACAGRCPYQPWLPAGLPRPPGRATRPLGGRRPHRPVVPAAPLEHLAGPLAGPGLEVTE